MIFKKPELTLATSETEDATVLRAVGSLDMDSAEHVERSVVAALDAQRDVIFDLSQLSLCDSTGLGVIVRMHRRAQASGRTFVLRGPRPAVADLLAMTGIDKMVQVSDA